MKRGLLVLCTALLAACSGDDVPTERLSPVAQLGEQIFRDENLSASRRMSCQTCHDRVTGHASLKDAPAEFGGANLDLQGGRNVPGMRYLRFNGRFHFDELTREHIRPVSRGGEDTWMNCITACRACNGRKGSRLPEEAVPETAPVAQLEAPFAYRPDPGSERDENPPIWRGGHYA